MGCCAVWDQSHLVYCVWQYTFTIFASGSFCHIGSLLQSLPLVLSPFILFQANLCSWHGIWGAKDLDPPGTLEWTHRGHCFIWIKFFKLFMFSVDWWFEKSWQLNHFISFQHLSSFQNDEKHCAFEYNHWYHRVINWCILKNTGQKFSWKTNEISPSKYSYSSSTHNLEMGKQTGEMSYFSLT